MYYIFCAKFHENQKVSRVFLVDLAMNDPIENLNHLCVEEFAYQVYSL